MLYDDIPKLETAEQRANRIWRNAHIQQQIDQQPTTIINDTTSLKKSLNKFKSDIIKIFSTRSNATLTNYIVSIQTRKNQLLKEKLKRLAQTDKK